MEILNIKISKILRRLRAQNEDKIMIIAKGVSPGRKMNKLKKNAVEKKRFHLRKY